MSSPARTSPRRTPSDRRSATAARQYAHIKGATILEGNRDAQFALDGLLKDLRLAQTTARSSGSTGYLDALEQLYSAASDAGHGGEDVAWVYDAIVPEGSHDA